MEILFGAGEIVRVTRTDVSDKAVGIKVGDIFRVIEDGSPCPYCEAIQSDADLSAYHYGYSLEQTQIERLTIEPQFNVGDLVEVVFLETIDETFGIQLGDVFKVMEKDLIPYCEPVQSDSMGKYAFKQDQLRLVKEDK